MGKILKSVLIVIGVAILLVIVAVVIFFVVANRRNKYYWEYAEPYGAIEKTYTAMGSSEVSFDEYNASDSSIKKYEIWYPSEMKEGGKTYPLVIMANGTGIKASQYKEVFKHFASWGFIVAGNEDENSRTGASSSSTLDFVLSLNNDASSKFFGKIDVNNIGIAGHSQGGVAALNAVTEQANGNKYKAIWAASATSKFHAAELNKSGAGWTCYPEKIRIPAMLVAGTGLMDAGNMDEYTATVNDGEAQGICPKWWLEECFASIPEGAVKVIAREKDKDHGDMLRYADGYMTAWFLYHLKGDASANFFGGSQAELLTNTNWQDVKVG